MTHHVLKAHPPMFYALKDGTKNFEVRKDDRAYQAGDTVEINYYDPPAAAVPPGSGFPMQQPAPAWPVERPKSIKVRKDDRSPWFGEITFVLRGNQYGVEDGYVVLALRELKD
nr:MAG TPA: activating signal cointegrator [Caudoviricetes sp.]